MGTEKGTKDGLASRLLFGARMGGALLFIWAILPLCIPPGEGPNKPWAGKPPAARPRYRVSPVAVVDLSTPAATFRSYLDSYEKCHAEGMYQCMSRRLRGCCGCGDMAEFCRTMAPACRQRPEDGAVVRYYRGLQPFIEKEFAVCPKLADRFEPAVPAPSRLAFVKEDGGWRLDRFDLYVPSEKK